MPLRFPALVVGALTGSVAAGHGCDENDHTICVRSKVDIGFDFTEKGGYAYSPSDVKRTKLSNWQKKTSADVDEVFCLRPGKRPKFLLVISEEDHKVKLHGKDWVCDLGTVGINPKHASKDDPDTEQDDYLVVVTTGDDCGREQPAVAVEAAASAFSENSQVEAAVGGETEAPKSDEAGGMHQSQRPSSSPTDSKEGALQSDPKRPWQEWFAAGVGTLVVAVVAAVAVFSATLWWFCAPPAPMPREIEQELQRMA